MINPTVFKLREQFVRLSPSQRIYNCPHAIIGITGGIACGKSIVINYLKKKSFPVISGDALVKQIYQDASTKQFIKENFPKAISDKGEIKGEIKDEINFKILREEFFSNQQSKKIIEQFIQPQIAIYFRNQLKQLTTSNFIFYEYPIIFEQNLANTFDVIVCVYCSLDTQISRLIKRDRIELSLAQNILSKQIPLIQKRDLSEFVIDNEDNADDIDLNSRCREIPISKETRRSCRGVLKRTSQAATTKLTPEMGISQQRLDKKIDKVVNTLLEHLI